MNQGSTAATAHLRRTWSGQGERYAGFLCCRCLSSVTLESCWNASSKAGSLHGRTWPSNHGRMAEGSVETSFEGVFRLAHASFVCHSYRHKQQEASVGRLAVVVPGRLPVAASRDPSLSPSSHSYTLSCPLRSLKLHTQSPWIARARPRPRRARRRRTAIASRAPALPVALERPRGCRSASSECAQLPTRADRCSPALPLTRPRPHRSPPLRLVPK